MSDRATQDAVIRALADASFRSSREWLDRELADTDRLERFAHFLARHFYYERIIHFFKYSNVLSSHTGRSPESALLKGEFDELLPEMTLGSRLTAVRVAALVSDHVRTAPGSADIEYLEDLLAYESAMMVAEAGPRRWRDDGPPLQDIEPGHIARKGTNFQLLQLKFDVTQILPDLLNGREKPLQAPAGPVRLMFSRSPHGRVIVAHSTPELENLLTLADDRAFQDILMASGLDENELKQTLRDLQDWGALEFSIGS